MHDQGTLRSISAKQSDSYLDAQREITAAKLAALQGEGFKLSTLQLVFAGLVIGAVAFAALASFGLL